MAFFEARQPFTMEYRMRRHDGEWRWVLDHGVPRYADRGGADEGREFLGYIGSCVDLTDRRLAEERAATLLAEKTQLAQRQAGLLAQQRAFLKDVLLATTDGVLRLCDSEADLPPAETEEASVPLTEASSLRQLRREVEGVAARCGLPEDRVSDVLTAASEAAMNVVTHAGGKGGEGRASCNAEGGIVRVRVSDSGPGIPLSRLHRAVLERGFTTANSLGHGFWLMLKTADRIHLWTEEGRGTSLVIEEWRSQPTPEWAERQGGSRPAATVPMRAAGGQGL
jgi:anti-sigma regulatory factor (Ser/Thr protein kinase)